MTVVSGNTPDPIAAFISRGVRMQASVDAAIAGSRVNAVRQELDHAIDACERGDPDVLDHVRRARAELGKLAADLSAHFSRFSGQDEPATKEPR